MKTQYLALITLLLFACQPLPKTYDLVITQALIYDGSGQQPYKGDIAINADTIAAVGDIGAFKAGQMVNVEGLAIAPGFINMLSWANVSLIEDGRSMSNIKQGVTLEVMGEGRSMGPWNDAMKQENLENQTDITYDIEWTTLAEYLLWLEKKGVSTNVASFVGNGTLRQHVIGYEKRTATEEELQAMGHLLEEEMKAGAMGISSSLLYAPSGSADTDELIALAKVASKYDGMYVSHIRNEGDQLIEAVEEFIAITKAAEITSEIYHLKASGPNNWDKLDTVFGMIESARSEGLAVTADMYTYPASSTGLHVQIPNWAREDGIEAMIKRLKNPGTRDQIAMEIEWRNPPETILLVGFKNPALRIHTGKRLSEVADELGKSAVETMIDLIVEDDSRIQVVYFSMSEDNINKKIQKPWMSFCSDAGSMAAEGVFLNRSTHPRAYGSFIRVLGEFARDRGVITLEEGIRRLTSFPASNLKIKKRGSLTAGYYADLVVFDPAQVRDNATFEDPHQYAEGVRHVWVNGEQVLNEGEHTGRLPGRFVRGPGYGATN